LGIILRGVPQPAGFKPDVAAREFGEEQWPEAGLRALREILYYSRTGFPVRRFRSRRLQGLDPVRKRDLSPAISVVIPHLNQHEELRRCLASLINQDFEPERVEFIVVDNGSARSPAAICNSGCRVRHVEEATPGPGPARNRGVSVAGGDILAFIDSDCIADRDWLSSIHAAFTRRDTQIIGGDVRILLNNPEMPTMLEAYESVFSYRQKEYIERKNFSGTGNLAVRRSVYQAVGPFAGIELAEDRDWGQRAARLGYSICYVPAMVVFHPARKALPDLYIKWDRHISHDFAESGQGLLSQLKWTMRAFAVAFSPILEVGRILKSERVSSWRERRLAAAALVRIRAYRSRRMLELLLGHPQAATSRSWNRL
jgi:glycosyltransferase involved in cell wall biosynthesis